jgi:rod shape-determining protein MreC
LIVNAGRSAGVELGMPVVTPEGVVGRVVATSSVTAQVMLITDERSGAGAIVGQLGSSQAFGSIRGLGDGDRLRMNYVSGVEKVEAGDRVWTTGQDAIYPPGLSVGEIVDVKQGSANTPHAITVRPSARLNSLEEVAVLLYQPPSRPPLDQALPNVNKKKQ